MNCARFLLFFPLIAVIFCDSDKLLNGGSKIEGNVKAITTVPDIQTSSNTEIHTYSTDSIAQFRNTIEGVANENTEYSESDNQNLAVQKILGRGNIKPDVFSNNKSINGNMKTEKNINDSTTATETQTANGTEIWTISTDSIIQFRITKEEMANSSDTVIENSTIWANSVSGNIKSNESNNNKLIKSETKIVENIKDQTTALDTEATSSHEIRTSPTTDSTVQTRYTKEERTDSSDSKIENLTLRANTGRGNIKLNESKINSDNYLNETTEESSSKTTPDALFNKNFHSNNFSYRNGSNTKETPLEDYLKNKNIKVKNIVLTIFRDTDSGSNKTEESTKKSTVFLISTGNSSAASGSNQTEELHQTKSPSEKSFTLNLQRIEANTSYEKNFTTSSNNGLNNRDAINITSTVKGNNDVDMEVDENNKSSIASFFDNIFSYSNHQNYYFINMHESYNKNRANPNKTSPNGKAKKGDEEDNR